MWKFDIDDFNLNLDILMENMWVYCIFVWSDLERKLDVVIRDINIYLFVMLMYFFVCKVYVFCSWFVIENGFLKYD